MTRWARAADAPTQRWTLRARLTSLRRDVCPSRPACRERLRRALPRVPLAGAGALQYRRRRMRPLGRAANPAASPSSTWAQTARCRRSATARCARARTGSPMRSRPMASGAVIGSRSCCRRLRRWRRATSPSTSSARSRCRWRSCSGTRRSPIACRIPAPGRSSPTPRDWKSSRAPAPPCPTSSSCCRSMARRTAPRIFTRYSRARLTNSRPSPPRPTTPR